MSLLLIAINAVNSLISVFPSCDAAHECAGTHRGLSVSSPWDLGDEGANRHKPT